MTGRAVIEHDGTGCDRTYGTDYIYDIFVDGGLVKVVWSSSLFSMQARHL
jgi:hypothetical protein